MAKLMLVEDDNNLREIYEARLQAEGYTIIAARDGEEALVMAKAEMPDLIISDVMMPKISGFEMLDILRNTDGLKDVKVIMLTALGQSEDQQRADRLGADKYLVKSQVTLEDIVKVAHDLLQDTPVPVPATPTPPATPVADPVQAVPVAVEPVAAPAPATPPAVVTPAVDSAAVADSQPSSEANESADMEDKIENFVVGATEDATAPLNTAPQIAIAVEPPAAPVAAPAPPDPTPVPVPATPAPPATPVADPVQAVPVAVEPPAAPVADPVQAVPVAVEPPAAPVADNGPTEDDDTVLANAAQRLKESTPGPNDEDKASGSPSAVLPSLAPPETNAPIAPTDIESGSAEQADTPTPEAVLTNAAHKKKVIVPTPADPNKKDISALLVEEEIKENQGPAQTPIVVTSEEQGSNPDLHNIAL